MGVNESCIAFTDPFEAEVVAAAHSAEFYMSSLLDRHPYEAWLRLGKPNMYTRAREKVREILAGPMVDPLPENVSMELDAILQQADRELVD